MMCDDGVYSNGTIHLVDTVTNAVLFSQVHVSCFSCPNCLSDRLLQAVVKATADSKAFATLAFRKSGAGRKL